MDRHHFLAGMHSALRPRNYIEIGINDGRGLALSRSRTIGVDPAFKITAEFACDVKMVRKTSDEFFAGPDPIARFPEGVVDFTFIDGLHLFEFALRDFINAERLSAPTSIVIFDDMLPRSAEEAARDRHTYFWTGDVFKVASVLERYRPDLVIVPLDTAPTGLLLVAACDPTSTVLADNYDAIVSEYVAADPQVVPDAVLRRTDAAEPGAVLQSPVWAEVAAARDSGAELPPTVRTLRALCGTAAQVPSSPMPQAAAQPKPVAQPKPGAPPKPARQPQPKPSVGNDVPRATRRRRLRGVKRRVAGSRLVEIRDRLDRRCLDTLGLAAGLASSSRGRDTLRRIEAAIGGHRIRHLVVIAAEAPAAVGRVFARRYPSAEITVLAHTDRVGVRRPRRRVTVHAAPTVQAMHEVLSLRPAAQVIIDSTVDRTIKRAGLRQLLFHVAADGLYLVDGLDSLRKAERQTKGGHDVWEALSRILQVKVDPDRVAHDGPDVDDAARADAVSSATHDGHLITVRKTGHHVLQLHDPEAERVLAGRIGPEWGRVLQTRPPVDEPIRGRAHANRLEKSFRTAMPVPRMYLREYRDVVCAPRQLAVQDDVVLPISFHHGLRGRLLSRSPLVEPAGPHFATVDPALATADRLPGTYYHLDSEFPGHFGHFMTEDIAKLWGWEAARADHPDIKILLSTLERQGRPSTVQRTLLEAWGISPTDVVCIDRPVRVDLLVGATQMFYNGIYVHPEMHGIWGRLRDRLRPADNGEQPRRLFATRPADALRPCRNADQVEALFAEYGFEIVRPELLSIPEQVDLFAGAEVIAGFAGSALFNGIYKTGPARWIVISSDRYLSRNEWAIAASKGHEYHHFFGEAERKPGQTEPWRVFQSPYSLDLATVGDALRAVLDSCS